MPYNPNIHHRRSIRLRGYDYSQGGAYFITICAQDRRHIFGHVENKVMVLNEFGQIAQQEWEKLPERWPHIELGAFQVMPNHIHGIIIIRVGAPLAGALTDDRADDLTDARADTPDGPIPLNSDGVHCGKGAPARGAPTEWSKKPTVGQIVGAYKSCVTIQSLKIIQIHHPEMILGKLWQRNFWENIIRTSVAFDRITDYIIHNPENWDSDTFHPVE